MGKHRRKTSLFSFEPGCHGLRTRAGRSILTAGYDSSVLPHALRDHQQIQALAIVSAIGLAGAYLTYVFVPPATAPRINVRWADTVTDSTRPTFERQLRLLAGEHLEGTTWAYDLEDPSQCGIEALITHSAVEDTHHIERPLRTVSADAPRGLTRIRGGLSNFRDGLPLEWIGRLSLSFLVVSGIWLATTGRRHDSMSLWRFKPSRSP